jgi:short-subunit dehydrogenase
MNDKRTKIRLGFIAALLSAAGLLIWRYLKHTRRSFFLPAGHPPGTALITGASSGIGATFARHLAAKGYDLVLVARREARLKALAEVLEREHTIRAEVWVADLAQAVEVEALAKHLQVQDSLTLLINNAGFGLPGSFNESDPARELAMINVHLAATVRLSKAALPGMIARGHGAIINVSSVAGFFPTPHAATYCASKRYLNVLSEALQGELEGTGIRIQALCPGFTRTEFHYTPAYKGVDWSQVPGFLWLSADRVVRESLEALEQGQTICIPTMRYRLLVRIGGNSLVWSLIKPIFFRMRGMLGIQL